MASIRLLRRRGWGNLHVPCEAPLDHLCRMGEVWGRFFIRRLHLTWVRLFC
jgi:hypothetical protein